MCGPCLHISVFVIGVEVIHLYIKGILNLKVNFCLLSFLVMFISAGMLNSIS